MIINRILFSKYEPNQRGVIWAKPVKGGFALYLFDGRWQPVKVMDDKDSYPVTDDNVIDVEEIGKQTEDLTKSITLKDIYVGAGDTIEDVMIDSNHYDNVNKGTQIEVTTFNNKIWMAVSGDQELSLLMSDITIPMSSEPSVTVDGTSYSVYSSSSEYSGEIEIVLA